MSADSVFGTRRAAYVFAGPAIAVYAFGVILPVLWSLGYTLFSGGLLTGFEFVGLGNFVALWTDAAFWQATRFTLSYATITVAGQLSVGLALAFIYVFWVQRGGNILRTVLFFPVILPTVAVARLFVQFFAAAPHNGLFNALLIAVGQQSTVQSWLGQSGSAFAILILMEVWIGMGFYAVLLYAGIIDVPLELMEAAKVDGATDWTIATRIVLPLLRPVVFVALIFASTNALRVFDSVLALTQGGPGSTTTPLSLYMYRQAFSFLNYGYASAVAVVLGLFVLVVLLFILRFVRRDVA